MEILHQLGELFLQAVPTVLIVFLFYLFMRGSFFGPMARVLSERRARTEGARRAAESSHSAAQERLRAYHDATRKARAGMYAEQETARRALLEERLALVRDARSRSSDEIRAAKERISAELATARVELDTISQSLAGDITRAILERRPPGPRPMPPAASEAR